MTNEEYNGEKLESYKAYMFCRCWCCQFIMIVAVLGIKVYESVYLVVLLGILSYR